MQAVETLGTQPEHSAEGQREEQGQQSDSRALPSWGVRITLASYQLRLAGIALLSLIQNEIASSHWSTLEPTVGH